MQNKNLYGKLCTNNPKKWKSSLPTLWCIKHGIWNQHTQNKMSTRRIQGVRRDKHERQAFKACQCPGRYSGELRHLNHRNNSLLIVEIILFLPLRCCRNKCWQIGWLMFGKYNKFHTRKESKVELMFMLVLNSYSVRNFRWKPRKQWLHTCKLGHLCHSSDFVLTKSFGNFIFLMPMPSRPFSLWLSWLIDEWKQT